MLFIDQNFEKLKFEYEQLWENMKHNSNLAYTVLGLSFPASAYLLYVVILDVGTIKPIVSLFLFVGSIFIAIAGYGIHARLNCWNNIYVAQSKEIEKKLGMYIWRLGGKENPLSELMIKIKDSDKMKPDEKFLANYRINSWYRLYIIILLLAWSFLIAYNLYFYQDLTNTALANLSMADKNITIGNVVNNTNSTIKINNFTVNIR